MRCTGGIFLFTKDDNLADHGRPDRFVPRDNVVFEAGFFSGLRGKRHLLIIREKARAACRPGWRHLRRASRQIRHLDD